MIKKKAIQIFSNGTVSIDKTIFKQSNKIKVYNKDHLSFNFNQKKFNQIPDSKNFLNFKKKYLKI